MQKTDVLMVLEELAASLKESAQDITVTSAFDEGRLTGYYEALSTLMTQCAVAGIRLSEIGMDNFQPESVLRRARTESKELHSA